MNESERGQSEVAMEDGSSEGLNRRERGQRVERRWRGREEGGKARSAIAAFFAERPEREDEREETTKHTSSSLSNRSSNSPGSKVLFKEARTARVSFVFVARRREGRRKRRRRRLATHLRIIRMLIYLPSSSSGLLLEPSNPLFDVSAVTRRGGRRRRMGDRAHCAGSFYRWRGGRE